MFSVPDCGWVNFKLGKFQDRASYLTDVPNELLDALIELYERHIPTCVYFDAEGWDWYILFHTYQTFIISKCNKLKVYNEGKSIHKQILNDIKNNINAWSEWDILEITDEGYKSQQNINRDELNIKINKLESLMGEN